jgi:hypothetical protein
MKNTGLGVRIAGLGLLLGVASLAAQTMLSPVYDVNRKVRLEGPVTKVAWINPGAVFTINVKDANGTITDWDVEFGNPLELERMGWSRFTLQIGDIVTVDGNPARKDSRQALATSVTLNRTGKKLFAGLNNKKPVKVTAGPVPRWPDGHPRLGPPPGKKGYWGAPSATTLVESTAAKIPITREGLLLNLTDVDKVAPFRPWAKALYEYRQRNLLKDDPFNRCLPPGGPRQFENPYGVQFIEQPDLGRVLVLLGGGDRNWRVIYTDGRPLGQPDDLVSTYYGTSVGRWEKDTLVVESIGFNERFWFTNGGLPHTEALHLTERFTRTDLNTLKYQVTVDDSRTYTRPWSGGWTIQWVPDEDIQEFFCEESTESMYARSFN